MTIWAMGTPGHFAPHHTLPSQQCCCRQRRNSMVHQVLSTRVLKTTKDENSTISLSYWEVGGRQSIRTGIKQLEPCDLGSGLLHGAFSSSSPISPKQKQPCTAPAPTSAVQHFFQPWVKFRTLGLCPPHCDPAVVRGTQVMAPGFHTYSSPKCAGGRIGSWT